MDFASRILSASNTANSLLFVKKLCPILEKKKANKKPKQKQNEAKNKTKPTTTSAMNSTFSTLGAFNIWLYLCYTIVQSINQEHFN
jgi:hypothetical protein